MCIRDRSMPKMVKATSKEIKVMHTKCMGPDDMITSLSGGNQQKVVLSKWLCANCKALIIDEPTRGIDVGAKKEIYELMGELVSEGIGIVMISSELPELIGMSDRLLIMKDGKITKEFQRSKELSDRDIINYMI